MTPPRSTKLFFIIIVTALHAPFTLSAEPSCTQQADEYNACIDANLALCEEGCLGPEQQRISTEDFVCGLMQGMFCVVHYCCQRTCTKEIKNYFNCLSQDMEECDLICLDDDDTSSGEMVGLSMLVVAVALSVAMHLNSY